MGFTFTAAPAFTRGDMDNYGEFRSLCSCRTIRWLHLYSNQFFGNIPSSLVKLTRLEDLELSLNDLRGSIPVWIGRLTSLVYVDFSDGG